MSLFNYTSTPQTTPELSRNQFGGSAGGPIWKNKLFAFGDYQGWRENIPAGITTTRVPTALMRQGNFTELLSSTGAGTATSVPIPAICPNLYAGGTLLPQFTAGYGYVYNPQTCLPFGWTGGVNTTQAGNIALNIIPTGAEHRRSRLPECVPQSEHFRRQHRDELAQLRARGSTTLRH